MTALECLTASLSAMAEHRITIRDGAILVCMARFQGITRKQVSKITGLELPVDAMKNLVGRGLVRVEVSPNNKKPNRHFLTDEGVSLVAAMVGKKEVAR